MRKFVCVALVVSGAGIAAMLLPTPLDAKGSAGMGRGGFSARAAFRPNIGPLARRGYPVARNIGPLAGRYLASRQRGHHYNGRGGPWYGDYGYGDYGYSDYGYGISYVDPAIQKDASDLYAPPPPPRIAKPVIRTVENSKDVCSSESVKVPATGGGETTVTILRC